MFYHKPRKKKINWSNPKEKKPVTPINKGSDIDKPLRHVRKFLQIPYKNDVLVFGAFRIEKRTLYTPLVTDYIFQLRIVTLMGIYYI